MGTTAVPEHLRAVIIRRLACYDTPTEVKSYLKEEFDAEVSTHTISKHNPTIKMSEGYLRKELVDLFWECRDSFQRGLDDVGIVWKAYRLKRLDEMEREARRAGNLDLAKQMLEQAAKEMGGAYEQRRKDGAITLDTLQRAIDELASAVVANVSDAEALRRIDEAWSQAGLGNERATSKEKREFGWS